MTYQTLIMNKNDKFYMKSRCLNKLKNLVIIKIQNISLKNLTINFFKMTTKWLESASKIPPSPPHHKPPLNVLTVFIHDDLTI